MEKGKVPVQSLKEIRMFQQGRDIVLWFTPLEYMVL